MSNCQQKADANYLLTEDVKQKNFTMIKILYKLGTQPK